MIMMCCFSQIKNGICGSVINAMGQEKKKTEPRPAKFVTPNYSLILKGEKTPVSETYLNDEYAIRKVNGNTFLHKVMPPRIRNVKVGRQHVST